MTVRVRNSPPLTDYDLLVAVIGYEPRCSAAPSILSSNSSNRIAWSFESAGVLAFDSNEKWFMDAGFSLEWASEVGLSEAIRLALVRLEPFEDRDVTIAIDVSCLSRNMIADVIAVLDGQSARRRLAVDFWYTPPKFDSGASRDPTIQIAQPISPDFAGLAADPALPVAAVIGIGYEPNLALGVSEYLDAAKVYAFVPRGHDVEYDKMNDAANSAFNLAANLIRRAEYDLRAPFELFARLESLTYGIASSNRVCLVPLGPKLFALCALLVAVRSEHPVAVWRFAGGEGINVRATEAGGPPVHLSVAFGADDDQSLV